MALKDTLIVNTEDIRGLYRRSPDKYIQPVEEMGLLPLTVEDLCTERGHALLELASWVFLSGGLHPTKYRPHISQTKSLLETLEDEKLAALEQEYKISENSNRTTLELKTNSGIFGRLLYGMGDPLPEGTNRSRKPHYSRDLPHFIGDIMASKPAKNEIEERKNLLTIVAAILFKDRFEMQTDEWGKDHYSLRLNHHQTKAQAESYGRQVVDFLNCVFERRNSQTVFDYDTISADKKTKHGKTLFLCSLRISDVNLGYLITKSPHILKPIQVDY